MAAEANRGCGLSHDFYVSRFSATVDGQIQTIAKGDRELALKIAEEFDYATPEAIEETAQWLSENGYCSHGIELGCCPVGCDFPDD